MNDKARQIRYALTDIPALCKALRVGCRREGANYKILCPWHDERSPSCSTRLGPDGTIAIRCHACGETGDALSLIAIVHRLDCRRDFREVLRIGAELANLWGLLDDERRDRPALAPRPLPAPARDYPPAGEVSAVWSGAGYVADDPATRAMLEARGLDVERIDDQALARTIPHDAQLPGGGRFSGRSWTETGHRLVLPVYDASGQMRSLRAWRVCNGDTPKRLPPGGHMAAGLVLADPFAVALLRGACAPGRIVIVEGEPDYLTWATRFSDADAEAPIVIGIGSGAWSAEIAGRIPDGARVILRTDHDPAGDRYADEVRASLAHRCALSRSRAPERRAA